MVIPTEESLVLQVGVGREVDNFTSEYHILEKPEEKLRIGQNYGGDRQ